MIIYKHDRSLKCVRFNEYWNDYFDNHHQLTNYYNHLRTFQDNSFNKRIDHPKPIKRIENSLVHIKVYKPFKNMDHLEDPVNGFKVIRGGSKHIRNVNIFIKLKRNGLK